MAELAYLTWRRKVRTFDFGECVFALSPRWKQDAFPLDPDRTIQHAINPVRLDYLFFQEAAPIARVLGGAIMQLSGLLFARTWPRIFSPRI